MYSVTHKDCLLLHGDCLEAIPGLEPGSVDMVLCDLPYGVTQNKWDSVIDLDTLWDRYELVTKQDSAIALFGSGMFTANLMQSNPSMWRYNLIWEKSSPSGFLNAKKQPLRSHEDIAVFYRQQPVYNPQMRLAERKVSAAHHKVSAKKNGQLRGVQHPYRVRQFRALPHERAQVPEGRAEVGDTPDPEARGLARMARADIHEPRRPRARQLHGKRVYRYRLHEHRETVHRDRA